jgi:hypothetical protein
MKIEKFSFILVLSVIGLSLISLNLCNGRETPTIINLEQNTQKVSQSGFIKQILVGHASEVWDVEFSPDGELIASASSDNSIILWNTTTGEIYRNLTGHLDSVYSLSFHPYEAVLASGSYDQTIILWNVTTGEYMYNLTGHTSSIWSLDFNEDGTFLASGSGDSTVRIWDYTTSNSIFNLTGHTEAVRSVYFLPTGILASGSYDDSILLWNVTTGNLEASLLNNTDNILSLTANPSGRILVSGSQDNILEFWDLMQYGSRYRAAITTSDWIRSVAYSPNGYFLASGLQDGDISIWHGTLGYHIRTLTGHTQSIRRLDFHPLEPILASVSGDKTVRLWDVEDLDLDQMPDYWELDNGLSPRNEYDGTGDLDGDGLSNINEFNFGTDPRLQDSDLDQISDNYEFIYGLDSTINDAHEDKDGDGMTNIYEFLNNLNSALDDSAMDSDSDGMPNLYEYQNGLQAGKDDADDDLDSDGMPNYFEYQYNFIIGIQDGEDDADSDGLSNSAEFLFGTNPRDSDSDNDFFNDNIEKIIGTDPNNFILNPITLLLAIIVLASLLGLLITAVIKSYPIVKAGSLRLGKKIKEKTKDTIEYYRPKPKQTWIQDLQMGKAIHMDTLSSELETNQINLPKAIKEYLTKDVQTNKALVLKSEMLLLESIPPKDTNCQVCIGDIQEENYFQCKSCKRFVCAPDYVDLIAVGSTDCPNCSGELFAFPFSCRGCGLDFSSVDELIGKSGCPICGYSLENQKNLISKITSGIQPSKITQTLQSQNDTVNKFESKKDN